jgi:hypothetical protein
MAPSNAAATAKERPESTPVTMSTTAQPMAAAGTTTRHHRPSTKPTSSSVGITRPAYSEALRGLLRRALRGVLSGWFAAKRGRPRGGTWVFLGVGIAGLIGRVVAGETLLTAILPIPFLGTAAACNEWLYERWSRTAQVNRVELGGN